MADASRFAAATSHSAAAVGYAGSFAARRAAAAFARFAAATFRSAGTVAFASHSADRCAAAAYDYFFSSLRLDHFSAAA